MALTKVTSGVRTLGTGEVATANMATDPTNADNLASGSVPTARLGNVDLTGLEDDVALLGFRVASNGSLAKYNLVDQTVDDFQDTSGVDASASTNETRDSSGKYYSGVTGTDPTGGAETSYTGYKVHTFLDTGNTDFVVSASGNVDALVVAGGGGGGSYGGAGGAGGFRTSATHALTAQTYVVAVGAGGAGSSGAAGSVGVNSVFDTVTSAGGGLGGHTATDGGDGGSGGGGGYDSDGGSGNTPVTSPVQGYDGGDGGSNTANYPSGGGGGAGGVGADAVPAQNGGNGGVGAQNLYRTGSNIYYASGGGGGVPYGGGYGTSTVAGTASAGGGGAGGRGENATAATVNTGGGGGGSGYNGDTGSARNGGAGGSGIVVIRYATTAFQAGVNMTLVSTTTAAQAAPTKGDVVFTYTNGVGSTTLGTDVTAEISADGGSTWTAMTLGSEGSTGSHNIATSHDVTISSTITAPYNMAYRIKTLNQSASKTTRIQAVSLGWS